MPFDLIKIGQLLRDTREKQGLTPDEVSRELFLRKRVVGAIESGNWENLPHPVYVRGYVRQYAAFLDIVDLLNTEIVSEEAASSGPRGATRRRKGIPKGRESGKRRGPVMNFVIAPWTIVDQFIGR
jgi:cytoskeleton protein RodZ